MSSVTLVVLSPRVGTVGELCNASGLYPRVGTIVGEFCNASGHSPRDGTVVGEFCNASGLSPRLVPLLVSSVTLMVFLPGWYHCW